MRVHSSRKLWWVLKQSFNDFSTYKITKKSAALAYYTIFSLPGMLIVIVTVLNTLYGQAAIQGAFQKKINTLVGDQVAFQVQNIIRNAAISGEASIATIIGVLVLIYGATKMFGEIQDSINLIWDIEPTPKKGWMKFIVDRLISFTMVIGLSLLLLASFILSGVITMLGGYLSGYFPAISVLFVSIINWAVSFVIVVILFSILFKGLPDVHIRWRDVTVGAFFTAVLFLLGKLLIGLYLSQGNIGSIYGATSSIVILLLWVYYSAIILYFGVAFTKEYAGVFGHDIYPSGAIWNKKIQLDESFSLQKINHISIKWQIVTEKNDHKSEQDEAR